MIHAAGPTHNITPSDPQRQYIDHPDTESADEAAVLSDLGFARVEVDADGRKQIVCDEEFAKSVLTFQRPETLVVTGETSRMGEFTSFFAGDWPSQDQFAVGLLDYLNSADEIPENREPTDKEIALHFEREYPAQHRALLEAVFRGCIAASRNFIIVPPTLRHDELASRMVVDFNDAVAPDPALQIAFNMGASPLTLRKDLQRCMRVRWSDQVSNEVRNVAHFFAREVFLQMPGANEDRVSGVMDSFNPQVKLADFIYTVLWATDFRIKLSNSPTFGFNYQAINALLDEHYESIDRKAIHACAVTFPVITWEKYRQAAAEIEQIEATLNAHKGLAPLHFPARFLLSHEAVRAARSYPDAKVEVMMDHFVRCFATELTPLALEALSEKSPRYLTSTLSRHFVGTVSPEWTGSCEDMAKTLARMFNVCAFRGSLPPYTMVVDRTFTGIALRHTKELLREARRVGAEHAEIDRLVDLQADVLVKMATTTQECHKRGAKLAHSLGKICNILADNHETSTDNLQMAVLGQLDNGYRERVKRITSSSLLNRMPQMKVRKWIWSPAEVSPMEDHRYRVVFTATSSADDSEAAPRGRVEIVLTRPENLLSDYIKARDTKVGNIELTLSVASEEERGQIRMDHDVWMQECADSIKRLETLLAEGYPLVAINNTPDAVTPAKIEGISAKEHVIASNKIAHFLEAHFKDVAERHPVAIAALFECEPKGYDRLYKRKYNASALVADFRRALAACSNKVVRDIVLAARDPMWVSESGKSYLDLALELCPAGDGTRPMASFVERAKTFTATLNALDEVGASEEYFNRSFDAAVDSFSSHKIEGVLVRTYLTPEQQATFKNLPKSIRTPSLDRAALGAVMRYQMRQAASSVAPTGGTRPSSERKRLAAVL